MECSRQACVQKTVIGLVAVILVYVIGVNLLALDNSNILLLPVTKIKSLKQTSFQHTAVSSIYQPANPGGSYNNTTYTLKQEDNKNKQAQNQKAKNEHANRQETNGNNGSYNILLFYGMKWWEQSYMKSRDAFESCSRRCKIVTDVKQSKLAKVVVMQADLITNKNIPVKQANQIWVFSEFESPVNLRSIGRPLVRKDILKAHYRKFNWTMGYRRDADFPVSHGQFKVKSEKSDEYVQILDELMKTKKQNSAWFNSHCHTASARESFGKLLKKYMPLEIYGTCGKVLEQCKPGVRFKEAFGVDKRETDPCMSYINKHFKFFMSFENSLCLDYVTEKSLQRIMPNFIVPVVRSNANHSLFHPPGSVVDTSRFANTEKLAKYLTSMDDNDYRTFYSWRKHYVMESMSSPWYENVCRLCERSYEPEKYSRLYEDIFNWLWMPNGRDACKKASDLQ